MMHGSEDRLTDPKGSEKFVENCAATDKELKIWNGCFHELINEPEKDQIIKNMMKWIKFRVKGTLAS